MSSDMNVLPTAPQYGETEKLYPDLPASNFRLQKISDVQKELEAKAAHYHQVTKKYKRAFTIAHGSAIRLGSLTAFLSSAGIATAVSGIGASVGIPIGGVAALTGLCSTGLTAFSKRLQTKLTKHKQTYTLAITKHNTVCELVSKALNDNKITNGEFNLILRELQNYHELKAAIRSAKNNQSGKPQPDIDEIKKQIRREERQNLQKKKSFLAAESKLNLNE